ncbi:hypothetical protein CCP4SC76_290011 [Gammaproteobacteria bacterium]
MRNRLYFQVLAWSIVPLILATTTLLVYLHQLTVDRRGQVAEALLDTGKRIDREFLEQIELLMRSAQLLAESDEVVQAYLDRDNDLLYRWGNRLIGARLAVAIDFVDRDGMIIARGHDEYGFNDRVMSPLLTVQAPKMALYRDAGVWTLAVGRDVVRFGVETLGKILVVHPLDASRLARFTETHGVTLLLSNVEPARPKSQGRVIFAVLRSQLPTLDDTPVWLLLERDAQAEMAELQHLQYVLIGLALVALVMFPVVISFFVGRLLRPIDAR